MHATCNDKIPLHGTSSVIGSDKCNHGSFLPPVRTRNLIVIPSMLFPVTTGITQPKLFQALASMLFPVTTGITQPKLFQALAYSSKLQKQLIISYQSLKGL